MALDFNQRSFTKTADQSVIDQGLRAYMLKVYNYMTMGLLITGVVAYAFGRASIVTNEFGQIIGITAIGNMLFKITLISYTNQKNILVTSQEVTTITYGKGEKTVL